MFNLLVSGGGWNGHRDSLSLGRVYVNDSWKTGGLPDFVRLTELPTIFSPEIDRFSASPQCAYVGEIIRCKVHGNEVVIEYRYLPNVPPIFLNDLIALAPALGIEPQRKRGFGELEHSAWSLKDADLFRILLTEGRKPNREPKVFQLATPQSVNQNLLAVMMPFSGFDVVWAGIQRAATECGMTAERADNRWEHAIIIQDIVSLIDQGAIVVCDCTGKNSNVFYEMGIAHALGKEVITITQQKDDIPFDIGHIRYIPYLPNDQGVQKLETDLAARIKTLRQQS
jgi:hypothetical protein